MTTTVMTKGCLLAAIVLHLVSVTRGDNCSEPCLIYSATTEINAIELSTLRSVHLVPNLQRAVALDVHVNEKTFYWSDINLHVIKRMNMSSGIIEDIITDDLGTVDGLAVEWESQLIYWSDYSNSRIEVASLDGSNRKLLFIEEIGKPRGIALYPKKGLMFWTDWGSTPKIERASLAGLDRIVLVDLTNSSQFWPVAVFVDYTEDRVYWIDAYVDVIDSTDLNGQNRRKLSDRVHPERDILPFDFTVYGDTLYWSDWNTDTIEKLDWTTAEYLGGFDVLTSDRVFGLALLDQSSQPASAGNQFCKINNGGCSHLCLLTPNGFVCACPSGLPLLPDGKNCLTDVTRFLLFAEGNNLRRLELHFNSSSSLRIPLTEQPLIPVALDYNFRDEKVYWTDVENYTISRAFLNGSCQETIVSTRPQNPYGLAVDSFGQNIYWTGGSEAVIEVASLNGLHRRVLIKNDLLDPRDIALDVTRGFMYWTDWGYDERIEKADMDGANRTIVIQTGLYYPNGLALDLTRNWLYWVDWYYKKLEVYEFPSKTRREIISSHAEAFLSSPFGLALFGNHLYWTDRTWRAIYSADTETGKKVQKVLSTNSRPTLIHAYDKNKTVTPVTDQCNINNGGCSHICLLTPVGGKCSCSDGFILKDDEKSCRRLVILPSSSTLIKSESTSASQTNTPLFSKPSSYQASVASSPTSMFNPPSSTEQLSTVSSTSVGPTPLSPAECRPNTCKNGGTCVVPGYFCVCQKYYVWNLCVVYVGSSAVEIELTFPNEKQWIGLNFRVAVAKACTNFFCKSGDCKSGPGRVKRSEKTTYFHHSDVKILGLSSFGENTWNVEFAVLFPSMDGKVPQPSPPDEVIRMVDENRGTIEKAVGGTIMRISIGKQPEQQKRSGKSTQDKGTSAVPIAAGVVSIVVVLILVAALVIYRTRRKGSHNNRQADDIQLENDWVTNTNSHTAFDNPTFNEDPTCDSISTATSRSVAEKVRQANEGDGSNSMSNPTYGVVNSGEHGIEDPEIRYASLQREKEPQKKEKNLGKDDD